MNETGKVVKVSGENATIQFERQPACKNCGMCFASGNDKKVELTLKNEVNAQEGDIVRVASSSASVLKSLIIVYGIPLVLFFAGIIFAHFTFGNDLLTFIIGFVFLAIGFFILKWVDKKIGKSRKSELLPKIVGIEKSEKEENIKKEII